MRIRQSLLFRTLSACQAHNALMSSLPRTWHPERRSPPWPRYQDWVSRAKRARPCRLQKIKFRVMRVMSEERRISVCKTSVEQIHMMLRSSPQDWRQYLNLARSVIRHLDATTFMQQPQRTTEQAWVIVGLQKLAHADTGNGDVPDIASWCTRQWGLVLQREPHNVAALRGMGQAWLRRAQPALSRIHRIDGSSSSGGSSSQWSVPSITSSEDDRQHAAALVEAERRSGTADYVEARGYLQPATDYFERAVTYAPQQGALSGDLLVMAAEAFMSLGNSSSPRANERHFRRALQLLRAANAITGYTLSRYLQQYLDDYGRLLE